MSAKTQEESFLHMSVSSLGGINSLRGFEREDLSPKKLNSEGVLTDIGGNKFVQINLEFIFPLIKGSGCHGCVIL